MCIKRVELNGFCSKLHTQKPAAMKRTIILLAAALLAATSISAQRTIKNVKFGTYSLNTTEENFVKKLEKAGWKAVEADKTTLQGKINGIDVTATIIPDKERETVGKIILFTDANATLNPTHYQVIKSWLEETYGKPTVNDLKDDDGDISCYWGSFKGGDRDLQKNNICITTADGEVTVATLINRENALDATMNNIGDAVESFGDKVNRTGKKAKEKGKEIKEKVKDKAEQIGEKITGKAEDTADWVADGAEGVWDKTKESTGNLGKKAKRIAKSAANGAKSAWRGVKNAVKKTDKATE